MDCCLIDVPPVTAVTVFYLFVASTVSTLKVSMTEKKGTCMKLREQLEVLEKETAAKLAEMDQYNKDMQVGICHYFSLLFGQMRVEQQQHSKYR